MPLDIKGYRVFIASPGGLEEERRAFRDTLVAYNEAEAIHDGAIFLPVGWEDTLGGVGRPQSIINDDLRKCDLFVLLLWDRWGSNPGGDGKYTSGTEEEFHVALECLRDQQHPMRQLVVLFKAVDPRWLADPGAHLTRVLDFKKRLEREREHLYQTFDTTRSFEELLRRHLGAWLRSARRGEPAPSPKAEITPVESAVAVPSVMKPIDADTGVIEEAVRLADEGRRTEAEALYARAIVGRNDPRALIAYGQFLIHDGRVAQAVPLLEHARQIAAVANDATSTADTMLLLAQTSRMRGDFKGAEQMYREVLEIDERSEGKANAYSNLGNILRMRGELDGAERMVRRALEIDERLGRQEGVANAYNDLGNVLRTRGELDIAEQMYLRALEINEQLGRLEGVASANGNLGSVRFASGDLDGAEQMYRRALEIDKQLGRREGVANAYGNLGIVLGTRGDLGGAEQMHRKALEIDERLGRQEGVANGYNNLGVVLRIRGDLDGAEQMYRRALEINERLGRLEGVANGYGNLGIVLSKRDDPRGAKQMFQTALGFFRRIGLLHRVQWVEARLRELGSTSEAVEDSVDTVRLDE